MSKDKVKVFSLAIVGSRCFHDYELLKYEADRIFKKKRFQNPDFIFMVVSGGARGADRLAKQYADSRGDIIYKEYRPDWKEYGKKAGIMRNYLIVQNSNMVLSFWNGKSKGTKHTMGFAQHVHKPLKIVRF
jgi:hypothetical protein